MYRYQKGFIYNGQTFVTDKEDIHDAINEDFVEGTAFLPEKIFEPRYIQHGKWLEEYRENIWGNCTLIFKCSACGKYTVDNQGITEKSRYCPNCGALMKEE